MKKKLIWITTLLIVCLCYTEAIAQGCSMCKAVVESNIQGGGEEASGLNSGILYILLFPYILFTLFVVYWRKHQKELKEDQTL